MGKLLLQVSILVVVFLQIGVSAQAQDRLGPVCNKKQGTCLTRPKSIQKSTRSLKYPAMILGYQKFINSVYSSK